MKLRRRRKEEGELTLLALPSPSQPAARAYAPPPPPTIVTALSSPTSAPPARTHHRPSFPSATGRKSDVLQLSLAIVVLLLPSFFIKLLERKSGREEPWRAPSLPTQLSYLTITGRAQLAAPLPLHPIGWPRLLSGSNGIFSVAVGAIGKQRIKINYPVSSPSLTNK